jgi:hypothetical protein
MIVARKRLDVVKAGEEERPFDKESDQAKYATIEAAPEIKNNHHSLALSAVERKRFAHYDMKNNTEGNGRRHQVEDTWRRGIREGGTIDDKLKYPEGPTVQRELGFGSDKSLPEIFFT